MGVIEIVNPAPGGAAYTSEKKAREHMARGRGIIEDGVFRFFDRSIRVSAVTSRDRFSIAVVDRWLFPHTQWFHGERS